MKRQPVHLPIYFHYLAAITLHNRNRLKAFLWQLFEQEEIELESLSYVFCSDDYLAEINLQYLNHSTYTDIITFQLSQAKAPIISDIYISVDRIKENAATYQTTLKEEIHRVIIHGALHLCGYKDKSEIEKKKMRKKEEYYLIKYFVSRDTVSLRNF